MNDREQHWENLFGQHTPEGTAWHGIWTVYSPDREVLKCYQGVRNFSANPDRTLITHTNTYTYADGSTATKSWQLDKPTCNQHDGVFHPAVSSMRALSLGLGVTAWVAQKFEPGKSFGVELFFRYEDWRTSIAHIYDNEGNLEKLTQIREHLDSFPEETPAPELTHFEGRWVGIAQSMTPDLQISPVQEIPALILDPTEGKNETVFLPDGVVVNVPKILPVGERFEIVALKQVADNEYQRRRAQYNWDGRFALLISEVFQREA